MSFTETLFGGLLSVVALYYIARRLGLSNYWGAILAGVIPFLIYLAASVSGVIRGDVMAIHLVVYMATAAVLGVFASAQQQGKQIHWGPKLLIAFFGGLVVLMALFLSISLHGVPAWVADMIMPGSHHQAMHTDFSGVSPNSHSVE